MIKDKIVNAWNKYYAWSLKYNDYFLLFLVGFSLADHVKFFMGYKVSPGVMLAGYSVVAFEVTLHVISKLIAKFKKWDTIS